MFGLCRRLRTTRIHIIVQSLMDLHLHSRRMDLACDGSGRADDDNL